MSWRRRHPFFRRRRPKGSPRPSPGERFPGGSPSDDDLGLNLRIRTVELPLPAIDQELVLRGRLLAGNGAVELSIDGIQIRQGTHDVNKLRFVDEDDLVADIAVYTEPGVRVDTDIIARGKDAATPEGALHLIAMTSDGARHAGAAAVGLHLDTPNDRIIIDAGKTQIGGAFVHNEAGFDHDFRVESDNEPHMFYVDAANDRIGIKTASPSSQCSLDFGSAEPLRLPRLTSTQRDALTPLPGMILFNTTTSSVQAYNGSTWTNL
jgi:hypothetical protein